jgi:glucose-6-phosphate 1-dehydrogenase
MRNEVMADPCVVVIFGASGDLTKRKLVPALYRLMKQRLIPAEFAVLGSARSVMSDDDFRASMREGLAKYGDVTIDDAVWAALRGDSIPSGISPIRKLSRS